jgi:hypothetical protein
MKVESTTKQYNLRKCTKNPLNCLLSLKHNPLHEKKFKENTQQINHWKSPIVPLLLCEVNPP